jgi:NitT/TauT family transport system substrate-binding protein
MFARIAGTIAIALSLATSAAAQETTIKFTLGWKTQGSDAAFFYANHVRRL